MNYQQKIDQLVHLIKEAGQVLALTGAGASTESGIPDFRSKESGLWNGMPVEELASIRALRKDPQKFYDFHLRWWEVCLGAKPNDTHYALAKLEQTGWLLGIITQNIDGLHQKAGSRRLWEVHGHLRTCYCPQCGQEFAINRLKEDYLCPDCGWILRPRVVLFGDPIPKDYFVAEKVLSGCQLLLVVGTSLQVHPVNTLPQRARRMVIINHEPTPWDSSAELVFRESSGKVLTDITKHLAHIPGPYFIK